jgi:hypothetical protein
MTLPTYLVELKFGASAFIDVTSYVQNISINRGITRVLDDFSAGTLSITFVNNARVFDPLNTSSPLWFGAGGYSIVQPGGQVRVTSNGIRRFTGRVQDWDFTFDEAGFDGKATLTALDQINVLSNTTFTDQTNFVRPDLVQATGDRVAMAINYLGLPNPIVLQAGDTLVGFDPNEVGDNALSYLQNVARSEPADFYSNASAVMVFEDRSFTDYTWATTTRQNVVAYPSTATWYGELDNLLEGSGWLSGTAHAGSLTPFISGTVNRGGTSIDTVDPSLSAVGFQYLDWNPIRYEYLGTSYVFSGFIRGYVGTIEIDYQLFDVNHAVVGATAFTVSPASTATWTNITRVVAATATVAGINLNVAVYGTAYPTTRIYGNGWLVEAGTAFTNYFDGQYNPDLNTTNTKYAVAWAGEAYKSMSGQVKSVASTATATNAITFADVNSQGASFGNGTGIPFTDLTVVYGSEQLYNQVQVVGVNATAIANDATGQTNYGLRSYSQTDNLTTSTTRPNAIAADYLAQFRLPEYRAETLTVALEALTAGQENIVLGLELRDVVRVCFKPSNTGDVIDKFYQILSISSNTDVERDAVTFTVASLDNMTFRLDSQYLGVLDADTLA